MRLGLIAAVLLASAAIAPAHAQQAQGELQPEEFGNVKIPPDTEMLFSVDLALNHVVDGRTYVLDAKTLKPLGIIGTSFLGMINVPNGTKDIYVATSHQTRTTRGERFDFVEIYSGEDLTFKEEIPISNNRAQALNYRALLQPSADFKYLYVQNATPATSVTVVDMAAKKQIGDIPNPGCYGIFPASKTATRIATLCGDGTLGTIDVKADGTGEMKASEAIFDPDKDAIFTSGYRWGEHWVLPSYAGNIYIINVDGETATLIDKIEVSKGVDGDWRPGGYQPLAVHDKNGVAYMLMHSNGTEGSHKNPAEEIWAVDLKEKKVVGRSKSVPGIALTVSQGDSPALFATDGLKAEVVRYDVPAAGKDFVLEPSATAPGGATPDQIEVR
ncbi:amine dehydrogenase large subunit [Mesorhizobium sp. LHD-90]|uniref:amine dehydrogenase large subunit n=1 Tax=Mesorhizobium sp. LHD-90 TaxID=3071414 RepID=UPI0027E16CD4|nr:amine dehydrogenase large subunit [Mesorhizobium sp. LHD-90]MDQ6434416.1 amine dehydrogenase large subunit [Mesorhizobium sp. LHD-90]